MKVTPMKLRDGSWGVRIVANRVDPVELEGQTVTVSTRSGKTFTKTIAEVIYTGKNKFGSGCVAFCRTASNGGGHPATPVAARSRPARRKPLEGRHTDYHCGCGNWSGVGSPCLYSYGEAKDEGEARYIDWS